MKVRIGFSLGAGAAADIDAETFWSVIDACESQGWDSIWFSERVTGGLADPLTAMAAVAGRTTKLKFGPSVLVLPGRNPVLLAKQLATLDVLSNGRFVAAFGLGAGFPKESQAFAVDRRQRAARTDEATELIRKLWTSDNVTYEGRHFQVADFTLRPKPVQKPAPDIWFGGHSAPALRRTGRLGDGWLPSFITVDEYKSKADEIRVHAAQAGREIEEDHYGCLVPYVPAGADPAPVFEVVKLRRDDVDPADVVVAGGMTNLRDRLAGFVEQGATKFVVVPALPVPDLVDEMAALKAAVVDPLEN